MRRVSRGVKAQSLRVMIEKLNQYYDSGDAGAHGTDVAVSSAIGNLMDAAATLEGPKGKKAEDDGGF